MRLEIYKVCLVTDTSNPLDDEELLFFKALKADNLFEVDVQAWDDVKTDWSRFDAIIIRTAWDYTKNVLTFIEWSKSVAAQGVDVINSPDVIEWNANKTYLLDLAAAGIPLLPTVLVKKSPLDLAELPKSDTGWIVKPTIGASARGVKRFDKDDAEGVRKYAAQLITSGTNVLIQPFAEEIANGEVSFVFFGDQYSHACKKTPAKGDFRVQLKYGGHDRYFDANSDQIAQARAVLEATPFKLLYVRVDMLEINEKFVLMELEAIEPYLYFGYNQAPQTFLAVLKDYLRRSRNSTT
jgi:glutathione synthase/RimK-type ligase-like ATP-grasp enzyme